MFYRFPVYCLIAFSLAVVCACAIPGSYATSRSGGVEKVYRYAEGGKKVLVYEVDAGGKLIVHDPNDSRAKMMQGHQKRQKEVEVANAAHIEKIRKAPKRKSSDPIYLYIKPVETRLKMSDKQKKDIFNYFRKQFENDRIIKLVSKPGTSSGELRKSFRSFRRSKEPAADAHLLITVSRDTVYGLRKGKVASAEAMVFKATVTGNWIPIERKAEDKGTLFQIPAATQRLSKRIKRVIVKDIGPTIPADRSL